MEKIFYKHKLENVIIISKIVTIHYLEFDRFFSYDGESHDFWELVYADKEDIIVRAENETLVLKEGEVIFHKPNEFHSLSSNKTTPPNVFIITFECRSKAMQYFYNKKLNLPPELTAHIKNIIKEAKRTFEMDKQNPFITGMTLKPQPPLGSQQIIRLNLEYLLIKLLRLESKNENSVVFVPSDSFDDALTNEVIGLLKANLYGNIQISEICEKLHFSKSTLYVTFKQKTGYGLKGYYNNLKIEEAKRLLREDLLSLTEISDKLSFGSFPYFCRTFKAHTGMTPSQYIKSVATPNCTPAKAVPQDP